MVAVAPDRNLRFAVLALQMNSVANEALIAAMKAWDLEKHKPLGQILVEAGSLTEADRERFERLVQLEIERTVDSPSGLWAEAAIDWARSGSKLDVDADRNSNLDHSSGDSTKSGQFAGRTFVNAAKSGNSRYRIIDFHARGGLGEVFVAFDEELGREVALKQIQERYTGNPEARTRFLLEAEITGRLEHPGIVPVYGLNQYLDGRPYYAMRFIRGNSLKESIRDLHNKKSKQYKSNDWILELRGLLGRFVGVCNAVAYAHSQGVLHRDLKPANVMLGPYGETLVVDWGIAKVIEHLEEDSNGIEKPRMPPTPNASALTQPGSVIGTLGYMSPEQASGDVSSLRPASDVYSLGATLYCLLTGRAPFEGEETTDILSNVRKGKFVRPRHRKRGIPKDLEAICLKGMALGSEDRYSSPTDIARDIEKWLADEPVTAKRDTILESTLRWRRKNPDGRVIVALLVGADILFLLDIYYLLYNTKTQILFESFVRCIVAILFFMQMHELFARTSDYVFAFLASLLPSNCRRLKEFLTAKRYSSH